MSNVAYTVDDLIRAVGATYRAIDIRSVAIRREDSWVNVMAAVRLTYEDVETAKARLAKLAQRFSPVKTDLLRMILPCAVRRLGLTFVWKLSQKACFRLAMGSSSCVNKYILSQGNGYIQWGYSRLRPFDGRAWPSITRDFEFGGVSPLVEGEFNRQAHLLGYGDVLEAANALCELNVSPQDRGCDLSVSFSVFANISDSRQHTRKADRC